MESNLNILHFQTPNLIKESYISLCNQNSTTIASLLWDMIFTLHNGDS